MSKQGRIAFVREETVATFNLGSELVFTFIFYWKTKPSDPCRACWQTRLPLWWWCILSTCCSWKHLSSSKNSCPPGFRFNLPKFQFWPASLGYLQPCVLLSRICCGGPASEIIWKKKDQNKSPEYHLETGIHAVKGSLGNLWSLKFVFWLHWWWTRRRRRCWWTRKMGRWWTRTRRRCTCRVSRVKTRPPSLSMPTDLKTSSDSTSSVVLNAPLEIEISCLWNE